MKEKYNITAVIKTFNAEKTLIDTLESLNGLDEIIVIDENSTDDTSIILKEYKVKIIYSNKFETDSAFFEAVETAKNDWIFLVEQEEIIPRVLLDEINSYISAEFKKKKNCIALSKKTFYRNRELKCLREKKELRVFKKGYADLKNKHSFQLKPGQTRIFKIKNNFILKYIKDDILSIIHSINEKNILKFKTHKNKNTNTASIFFKPLITFVYFYFIKGGCFFTRSGYIFCLLKAYEKFIYEMLKLEKKEK